MPSCIYIGTFFIQWKVISESVEHREESVKLAPVKHRKWLEIGNDCFHRKWLETWDMTSFCLRFHSCSMLSDSLYTHVLRTNCELTLNQVFSFHSSDRISELLILIDSKTVQTMSKNITRIYVFYVRKICFFASAKHFICFIYRGLPFKILNL